MTENRLHEIRHEVMWTRLISVVEEQAQTLVRTAFSTSTQPSTKSGSGKFEPGNKMTWAGPPTPRQRRDWKR